MTLWSRIAGAVIAGAVTVIGLGGLETAAAQEKVRVALGDVVSVETLAFLIALERAKEKGLDYELTSFAEEELAIQAIVGGQADVGIGTPYSVIQKTKVPLRNIFQVSTLVFYPVVSTEYKTWKDLDGEPFTFHARGTATEAYGNVIAAREGITFGQRSYVPGSENRVVAMLNGTIKATVVDLSNKNLLLKQAPDRFHVLPGIEEKVSDEILFANENWIKDHSEAATILTQELLTLWREMNADPTVVEKERAARKLLSDQPAEVLAEVDSYYKEGVEAGLWNPEGASEKIAKDDFAFYTSSGQLEGPAENLKVEEFWDFGPLKAAKAKSGG
ncbi:MULTISPECIES: ABC transporter substrate-binding protein [unclassified Sinorhizobium]|uniref:ABC transporter substrate-binding protein n=1 Tax=unclassified Sinorhizobium TaxID=2613772 RepID=UPI0024C4627F|nr:MULTISPECIES: ABC transporter substrate-binding protein [unclassified Sinorhizobium]MDK1374509.1 ABC transporter substrate-binding protein [Sinorhizobium sp. 6-70]MDK1479161.1 ABC transporter substrate-binding protein [Sinorhizobium sp. 6-117]